MESGWVQGRNVPLYYLEVIHSIILEALLIDLDWVQKLISLVPPTENSDVANGVSSESSLIRA